MHRSGQSLELLGGRRAPPGRISILQNLQQQTPTKETNGDQHPKQSGCAKNFRGHGGIRGAATYLAAARAKSPATVKMMFHGASLLR
jgi:hypothetical protein